jgi:hypothetical protein
MMQNMGNQSADLTFFDSKMLTAKAGSQRAPQQRPQISNASRMQTNLNQNPQFFNKTGPIKLQHNSRSAPAGN